ncbi:hypothetical protein [Pseudomarimonas salicorniae]|uniref:Uncharacterized protein n=1 Tax=Pseudomarimonas salicorniae TaxID=2933270 RepID=A0ABT0GHL6_9GAMM|nr:hypothetical protein [Lysobacter sp. CAU 1642]MCK7594034.1 hypothetical protein [Lysobacter sp. CAU 1642]
MMIVRLSVLMLLAGFATGSAAFSSGSTVCEVDALPFVPMSGVLRQPPPSGWRLVSDGDAWYPGAIRRLRLLNDDPARRARGVLVWVKGSRFGSPVGAGRFLDLGVSDRFRFSGSSSGQCGEWSLTHIDAVPKPQSELVFAWQAPIADPPFGLVLRAFVIEDCDALPGVCRDAQALTAFLPLREALFAEGFE